MSNPEYLYTTTRLGLRPLSSQELNGPYPSWFLDAEVNQYNSHFRLPSSSDAVSAFVSSLKNDKSRLVLAVFWLATHSHVGNISLQQIDHFNRSAELAFLFGDKALWGQGIAYEAAETLMQHAQEYLAIRRFTLGCLTVNHGMIRLAEKLGFTREGTLNQALWHEGEFRDVALYGKNATK